MKIAKVLLLAGSVAVLLGMVTHAGAQQGFLLTPEKGMVGMGTMANLDIITLRDSVNAGKKMFNDTKLGHNTTGQSCATCHSGGGSVGGSLLGGCWGGTAAALGPVTPRGLLGGERPLHPCPCARSLDARGARARCWGPPARLRFC